MYTNIYTHYLQGEERETVEHKLKKELIYIIEKLINLKDFVFYDSQKKEANAHCTYLQIEQVNPLTKICKREQFSTLMNLYYF